MARQQAGWNTTAPEAMGPHMAELQQAVSQVTGDLARPKDHFDRASAATTAAIAEQGQKMTLRDSDLRKLHDVANETIAAVNVKLNGMAAAPKQSKEHTRGVLFAVKTCYPRCSLTRKSGGSGKKK